MKKLNFFIFLFVFFSSCGLAKTFHFNNKITPKIFDPLLMDQKEYSNRIENKRRKIIAGQYMVSDSLGFKLCLEDRNNNGKYMEKGIDAIGITDFSDSTVLIETMLDESVYFGTASLIKDNLLFGYYDKKYSITDYDEDRKTLWFKEINHSTKPFDFLLTDKLINFKYRDLISGKNNLLYQNLDRSKEYYMLVFWTPLCRPCIEEMPLLKKLSKYSVQIINICGMCDENEAKNIVVQKDLPGLQILSNRYVESVFHQNGFPYILLFDKDLKKIKRIFPIAEAVNIIVKD